MKRAASHPVIDLSLLKSRPFLAANLLNFAMGVGFFGVYAFVPLYVTSVYELSTLMSGMILTPRSLGHIPASVITSFLLRRWGYRRPVAWGLSIVGLRSRCFLPPASPPGASSAAGWAR